MYLNIADEVFNNVEFFDKIEELLILLDTGRHDLIIENGQEDVIMQSAWYKSLSERKSYSVLQFISKTLVKNEYLQTQSNLDTKRISITEYEFDAILEYLNEPVYLVLEDVESDKKFLEAIVNKYKNKSKKIRKYLANKWIRYVHAGGKTHVIKVMTNQINGFQVLPEIFLLLDSDKESPDDELSKEVKQIIEFCDFYDISFHVLYKREIENYLPDETLQEHIPHELNEILKAYLELTPDQKDFLDFEKGFKNKRPTIALFNGIDDKIYSGLKDGFSWGKIINPKSEFHKYFESESCSQELLNSRCGHQPNPMELKDIVVSISKIL